MARARRCRGRDRPAARGARRGHRGRPHAPGHAAGSRTSGTPACSSPSSAPSTTRTRRALSRMRHSAASAMAVALDVDRWARTRDARADGDQDGPGAAWLKAHGWKAATARPDVPVSTTWQELGVPPDAARAPGSRARSAGGCREQGPPRLAGHDLGSLLAALTTWIALWAWAGFVERPSGFLVPLFGVGCSWRRPGCCCARPASPACSPRWARRGWSRCGCTTAGRTDLALGGWIPTDESMARFGEVLRDSVTAAQSYAAPVPGLGPGDLPAAHRHGCGCVGAGRLPRLRAAPGPGRRAPAARGLHRPGRASSTAACPGGSSRRRDELPVPARRATRHDGWSHWGRQISRSATGVFDSPRDPRAAETVRPRPARSASPRPGWRCVVPIFIPTFSGSLFDRERPRRGRGRRRGDHRQPDGRPQARPGARTRRGPARRLHGHRRPDVPAGLGARLVRRRDLEALGPRDPRGAARRGPAPPAARPELGGDAAGGRPSRSGPATTFDSQWLPAPYPVSSIEARGDWRYDTDTFDFISAAEGQSTVGPGVRPLGAPGRAAPASTLATPAPRPRTSSRPTPTCRTTCPTGCRAWPAR